MSELYTTIYSLYSSCKQTPKLNDNYYRSMIIMKCYSTLYIEKILYLLYTLTGMKFDFVSRMVADKTYCINVYHNIPDIEHTINRLDKSIWILRDDTALICNNKSSKQHYLKFNNHPYNCLFYRPIRLCLTTKDIPVKKIKSVIKHSSKILLNDGEYYIHNPY